MSPSWAGRLRADGGFALDSDMDVASASASASSSSSTAALGRTRVANHEETGHEEGGPTSRPFIELYRAHAGYVWTSARRLGVPAAEADDVVQETFLRALRVTDRHPELGSERSWLFAILFRVVQHHRRSHQRRSARTEDGVDLEVLPGAMGDAPDRHAENVQSVRMLEEILDELDPDRRAVLVLAELDEKPVREIAVILGINANTATTRLRAAREQVEAALSRRRARDGWRCK